VSNRGVGYSIVFLENTTVTEGLAQKSQATITPIMNFWVRVFLGFRHHLRFSSGLSK